MISLCISRWTTIILAVFSYVVFLPAASGLLSDHFCLLYRLLERNAHLTTTVKIGADALVTHTPIKIQTLRIMKWATFSPFVNPFLDASLVYANWIPKNVNANATLYYCVMRMWRSYINKNTRITNIGYPHTRYCTCHCIIIIFFFFISFLFVVSFCFWHWIDFGISNIRNCLFASHHYLPLIAFCASIFIEIVFKVNLNILSWHLYLSIRLNIQ